MNARKIKKLRKQISEPGYYERRWDYLSKLCEKWEDFLRWKCDSFFVGEERAQRNLYKYNTEGYRTSLKCKYYQRKVTNKD